MGDKNEPELKRLRQQGKEIPDRLLPPLLNMGLELYFMAFYDLATTRVDHAAPISWLSIEEYADRLGLNADVRQELHHHVRHLDKIYLDHRAKKAKESRSKGREDKGRHPFQRSAAKPAPRGGRG